MASARGRSTATLDDMKSRCIITSQLDAAALRAELSYVASYFSARAHVTCKILFGFAWGNEYYDGDWIDEEIALDSVAAKTREVEASGFGRLGRDDLYVSVSGLEFQFCHESDLHLRFDESDDAVEHFFGRWGGLGFAPTEWLCDSKEVPKTKVRAYVV
jgi:hypothetical protein